MKYLSLNSVFSAYKRNTLTTTNKFWGILGILVSIRENIIPGKSYIINNEATATFLENLFALGDRRDYSNISSNTYAIFSDKWLEKIEELMCSNTPNFFDVATWFFRNEKFDSIPSNQDLIVLFCKRTGLTQEQVSQFFSFNANHIEFEDYKYDDKQLLSLVEKEYGNEKHYSSITAEGTFIKANPGEFSRAPFIQTLYAAQQTTECLLITQFPLEELYNTLRRANNRPSIETYSISYEGKVHILNFLRAVRTKPFLLLAGISGTGKSRIVRKLAQATVTEELQKKYDENFDSKDFENKRWNLHRPANFELIQVKPNWHNSMDVVGYLSNIPSPHYVFTPFINFIVKAWQNPDVPFFLCLDEMNLAPVEEYFAEFLSAIESRSKEGDIYVTDPLIKPFNDFSKIENDKGKEVDVTANMLKQLFPDIDITDIEDDNLKDLVKTFKTKGLSLPQNLIVIGTVNMDETTFSFSRKVLDRAMSIEMNEVNYGAFLSGNTDDGLKDLVADIPDLNKKLVDRPINVTDIFDSSDSDANNVIEYLERINHLLDGTPFKLGYRAANEALLYLNASGDFGNPDWRSAMDSFTLMKILSRIEGDSNKLKIEEKGADKERLDKSQVEPSKAKQYGSLTILTALRVIIEEELSEPAATEPEKSETTTDVADEIFPEASSLTKEISKPKELESIKKLDSMISQLERERFVSYWN